MTLSGNQGSLVPGYLLDPFFWHDRTTWPKSSDEHIFLGDAVMEAGPAMFPFDWDDNNFNAQHAGIEPESAARDRLEEVAQWIARSAAGRKFDTFGFDESGPTIRKVDQAIWMRSDAFPKLFWNCLVEPTEEIATLDKKGISPRPLFIFFDRSRFEAELAALARKFKPKGARFAAEKACEKWLHTQFENDPEHYVRKQELRKAAVRSKNMPFLSGRGFDDVWDIVAPQYGRTEPGRPKKQ